jgi:NADH-quinone oxidoreductase subunit M
VAFLAFVFAHVGFPGSLAFVAEDLMLHGVLAAHPIVGGVVLGASALNAITAFRAYQRTFLGPRPAGAGATSDLVPRERAVAAVLLLAVMLAGVFPGPILSWAR